jgi:lysylphosphatidylglycerol synthetase-like protein (DUF2156 family)
MNIPDTGYLLFAIIILAVIVALVFILKPAGQKKKLSRLAAIAFAFIITGIFLGEVRWLGYSLMGTGILLAVADIIIKSGKQRRNN